MTTTRARLLLFAVALAGALAGKGCGCDADRDLAKINPLAVAAGGDTSSAAAVWALFDRDTVSGWTPTAAVTDVTVSLGAQVRIAGLKVFGPAPYTLDVSRETSAE